MGEEEFLAKTRGAFLKRPFGNNVPHRTLRCSRLGQVLVRPTKKRKRRGKKDVEQGHLGVVPEVLMLLRHILGLCHSEGNSDQNFSNIFPGLKGSVQDNNGYSS